MKLIRHLHLLAFGIIAAISCSIGLPTSSAREPIAQTKARVTSPTKDGSAPSTKGPGRSTAKTSATKANTSSDKTMVAVGKMKGQMKRLEADLAIAKKKDAQEKQKGTHVENDEVPKAVAVTEDTHGEYRPAIAPRASEVSPQPRSAPAAKKANLPGFVISPFPPYKLIDATNLTAGKVVKDPDTGEIFRLPHDLVEVTMADAG